MSSLKKFSFSNILYFILISCIAHAEKNLKCSFASQVEPLCKKLSDAPKNKKLQIGESIFPSADSIENQVADFKKRQSTAVSGRSVLSAQEQKRFESLLARTKEAAIRVVIGPSRGESVLSSSEKNLLSRIKNLSLSPLSEVSDSKICETPGHWGYNHLTDKVVLCPILNEYSDRSIVQAIGNAIGFAVGECSTQLPKSKGLPQPIEKNENPFQLFCTAERCQPNGGLRSCLIAAKQISSEIKISFDSDEAKATIAQAEEFFSGQKKKLSPDEISKLARENVEDNVNRFPACFPSITGYQVPSAIADWFSSQIIVEDSSNFAVTDRTDLLATYSGFLVDEACRLRKIKAIDKQNGHPAHEIRFNEVLFRNSSFRDLVGCKREAAANPDCSLSYPKSNSVPASSLDGTEKAVVK